MYEEERGVLILASTQEDIAPACALCYSIKNNNPNEKVSIVTDIQLAVDIFDQVIEWPFAMDVESNKYQIWQAYWATPYKYTMLIDAANLVNYRLDQTFDYLIDHHNLGFNTSTYDFRMNKVNIETEIYEKNKIKPVNSNVIFFTKETEEAICFFKMLDVYTKHFQLMYQQFLRKEDYDDILDIDLIVSMVINHLDIYDDCTTIYELYPNIDMHWIPHNPNGDAWTKIINFWSNSYGSIKIQNYTFNGIMRYRDTNFITDDIVDTLGGIYADRTK